MAKDDKRSLTPRLRFPEFRDGNGWKVRPLLEMLARSPEYGVNAAGVPYSESLPTYLRITDIDDDGRFLTESKVSVDAEIGEDNYLNDGDVVLARTGASVGKSYRYREDDGRLVFAGFLIRVRPNPEKLLPNLLANYLETRQYWDWVRMASARSGQPGINGSEYAALPIPLPHSETDDYGLVEQQKIADCLTSLDELIAAQGRKVDALKSHKKGLMQQLFPRESETLPRLRFPEFHDNAAWHSSSLGLVCDLKAGEFVSASAISDVQSNDLFPCYGGNGLRGYVASFTHEGLYVLVGRQGALCGNVNLFSGKFHATEHALVATPKPGIEVGWLYYAITGLKLNRFAIGQAQPGLSVTVLNAVDLGVPATKAEQQRIADCFSALDARIAAEAGKLATLKTHKKGLMQQLFPSPSGDRSA